jgi:hypothetical protein
MSQSHLSPAVSRSLGHHTPSRELERGPGRGSGRGPGRGPGRRWLVLPALVALLALLVTSLAGSTAVAAPPPLQPEIGIRPLGVLTDGGATLAPSLVVRCAPSDHMREGFASVGQGDIAPS